MCSAPVEPHLVALKLSSVVCAVLGLVAQSGPILRPRGLQPARLLCAWDSQEHWSGLPCPPPGDLPNPGIKPRYPALHVDSLPSKPLGKPTVVYSNFKYVSFYEICTMSIVYSILLY